MTVRHTQAWKADLRVAAENSHRSEPPSREGQTIGGSSRVVRYMNFVKLPHTVFALPFALLGTVYASQTASVGVRALVLIVVAFAAARFAAMGFNRIVDRKIDSLNPRTMRRELPEGRITLRQAWVAVGVAAVVFVGAAALLNRLTLILSLPALAWILAYSYTKRFTSLSHLWLGASLAIAPAGGYIAVTGTWSDPWWTLATVAGAVALWVGGFDIFYALQDRAFDREHGLRSAVVLLGESGSIMLAKLFHGITIALLALFGVGAGFGLAYFVGVAVAAGILAWEHRQVKPGDLSRLNAAFFSANGIMSIVVFLGALVDRVVLA